MVKLKTKKRDGEAFGRFSKRSVFDFPVESVFAWHERDGAIERLSPPRVPLKVIFKSGGIQPKASIILGMKEVPYKYKWHAAHTDYVKNRLFKDKQTKGPLSSWEHTHRFKSINDKQCVLGFRRWH